MGEVIRPYKDMEKRLLFYSGEQHQVTANRAKMLVSAGVAKVLSDKNTEKDDG